MKNYVIFTDSSCDLSKAMIESRAIGCVPLSFRFDSDDRIYYNGEIEAENFYKEMRNGALVKTSAVNPDDFAKAFRTDLESKRDILYIGFSSGLSTTFNSARIAAEMLKSEFPNRKIITVDTLAASAGIALLIDLIIEKKENGASIEEAAEFAEQTKLKISHWFTVDDLVYLKRGGRISPSAALIGNMLGIKPMLHVDNEGHLINVQKIRGRRLAIETLANKCNLTRDPNYPAIAYISHADCNNDALLLAEILKVKYGVETKLITDVGAVIGAHSGPGTLALFFVGNER